MGIRECNAASEVDCTGRHCTDPQHCPCVNYDVHEDYLCGKEDYEVFFPDMNDCARFLDCSNGCINSILVSRR